MRTNKVIYFGKVIFKLLVFTSFNMTQISNLTKHSGKLFNLLDVSKQQYLERNAQQYLRANISCIHKYVKAFSEK